jgi:Leucine-rich repeat (LRR) protein
MKNNATIFIFIILSLLLSTSATFAQSSMTMTTDATIIRLGLAGTGDIIIDWGDETSNTTATLTYDLTNYSHNYSGSSTHTITIIGENVTGFSCYGNQLTSLDVSNCRALTQLYCDNNQLTSLDVSNNSALTYLSCYGNQLTSLDVSNNSALTDLSCSRNQLTSLDVSKNNALEGLQCNNNLLTIVDLSNNTALRSLSCDNNQLTSLDVSKNNALEGLQCNNNPLTSLDVSNNTALTFLSCDNNQLTSLDVSKNNALEMLQCNNNPLTSLDVSNNTALTFLSCFRNQLRSLDVSKNNALEMLQCDNNQLTNLNVSNNTALRSLSCDNNQLTSAELDALFGTLNSSTIWGKTISIYNNPGTSSCNRCIATNKGWTLYPQVASYITTSTSSLTFGDVSINNTKDLIVTITNNGSSNLTISSIDITGTGFTIVSGGSSGTLVGFASCDVVVRFSPTATGAYTGSITLTHNASCSPHTINLTGNGVIPTLVEEPTELPTAYNLAQNYPNPFNPSTKIEYSLPEASMVRLAVYNSLGQEVTSLVNEYKDAGKYIVDFNASNLPSGIYLYKIQAGNFNKTQKMVLMK